MIPAPGAEGPRLFRAKQMALSSSAGENGDDDDNGETEVKKVEKTALEQLREIQDNIEFQYGMLVEVEWSR